MVIRDIITYNSGRKGGFKMKKRSSILLVAILLLSLVLPVHNSLAAGFGDVPSSHTNYKDIMYLLEKGVIEDSKTFGVSTIVTREEVAVMVSKAVGLDGTQRNTVFNDVQKNNKNSGYIQSAVEAGIITGYPDGTFKPNNLVTRGHMAAFIARAFELPAGTKTFSDVSSNNTAYTAVKQLAAAGITTGYNDGTFKPQNNLTRAHISAFLARAIKYQSEQKIVVGKTRNTAAKLNETVLVEVDDWLDGKQKYELTLTEVVSGQEAWSIIEKANMFNEEPDAGMKYILAKFKVKVHSLEVEPFDINHVKFDAVSKTGSMYNQFFAIVTPTPDLSTNLYSGAEYEGWTYFMVNENDSPKVVYESKRDAEAWFDLGL